MPKHHGPRKQPTEVHTLTELRYAEIGEGPWKIYLYGPDGYHSGGKWFRKGKPKYPDEELSIIEAKCYSDANILQGLEVRVCDGGDMLVFHSQGGAVIYGEGFWEAATAQ
jgi:hypothetical protein